MNDKTFISGNNTDRSRYYETYEDFLKRIFSFQKPNFSFGTENFVPNNSVKHKVDKDCSFKKFIGDTVVFDLEEPLKKFIQEHYINPLYYVASNCFAEKLGQNTLHMTLHDLNASSPYDNNTTKNMFDTEISLAQKLYRAPVKPQTINMITTCVFNMVNTSLVLGLMPKTKEDYDILMRLYQFVDDIHSLPYPFTPHITLSYFNRNGFSGNVLNNLQQAINRLNYERFEFTLSTDMLYYQKFTSMNDYFHIMRFTNKIL